MKTPFSISPQKYDAWFSTPRGREILAQEKALMDRMMWQVRGRLLDIGCGTGIFTLFFQEKGFTTVGLDLSTDMLRHLKRKAPHLPLVQGDARLLPFPPDSFQYASLITVLEFLEHPLYALVEAVGVARKGILIGFLPPWSPTNLKRRAKALVGKSSFSGARFFPSSRLASMIKKACKMKGRKIQEITVEGCLPPARLPFPSLASFAVMRVDYE